MNFALATGLCLVVLFNIGTVHGQDGVVLLVAGGEEDGFSPPTEDAEYFYLDSDEVPCVKPRDYPDKIQDGPSGNLPSGYGITCAERCHLWEPSLNAWVAGESLPVQPAARAAHPDVGVFFSGFDLGPTIIYLTRDGFEIEEYALTPARRENHCMVAIDENTLLLAGGSDGEQETWIYNKTEGKWSLGGKMALNEKGWANCEAVTRPDGTKEVVVVGGWDWRTYESIDMVEVFSFETMEWRTEENFPGGGIRDAATVPYNGGFLLVAGDLDEEPFRRDTVWQYSSDGNWTLLPGKLQMGRESPSAMLVNIDELPPCDS